MESPRYTIGLDFGTLSARAMLTDVSNGACTATASMDYPHGVMDRALPSGVPLPPDFALQHPRDYMDALKAVIRSVMRDAGCRAEQVIGIGCDFTQCTMMPVDEGGMPLCLQPDFENEPYAYPKLWKHHAAQPEANQINRLVDPAQLLRYGGKISCEWMIPKVLETYVHAPHVFAVADQFVELADWIPRYLTGSSVRSTSIASVAAMWDPQTGYPDNVFLESLAPGFAAAFHRTMAGELAPIGSAQGFLKADMARALGLCPGIPVAVGIGDCHAAVCGAGIVSPNRMLMVLGTSGCDLIATKKECLVPGLCGICYESMLPGLYGYEAGQPSVGDLLQWFVTQCVPASYFEAAGESGKGIFDYLNSLCQSLKPGQSGLAALDWWNGNRCVFMDADLSGLMIGMTLSTKAEEIYQALIEGLAFGKRMILERMEAGGIGIEEIIACGGIAEKNRYFLQVLSDVLQKPIRLSATSNASCQGAAVLAAVAAGSARGGYDELIAAGSSMSGRTHHAIFPRNIPAYADMYAVFCELAEHYAAQGSLMHRLKDIRNRDYSI